MKKRIKLLSLTCAMLISMAGCGNYVIEDDNSNAQSVSMENPFEEKEEGSLATLRHGESNPNRDENQNVLPYEYNGGEFSFEYYFLTEGNLDNVGFLLFLDGEPQAYKVNSTDAVLVLQYEAGILGDVEFDETAADVNNDGKVNSTDSVLILQFEAKLITEF